MRYNDYVNKQSYTKSFEYLKDKYGEEKALYINKSKSNSLSSYIKKYGEEEGKLRYEKLINKHKNYYSKISQILFDELDKEISKYFKTYYATKNGEYGVYLGDKYIFLDYYIEELNLCIEFNGTMFHADKRFYNEQDRPNPYNKDLTSKDIWENDLERYNKLKSIRNIDTIVIWESDF